MASSPKKSEHETYATDYVKSDTPQAVFLGNPMLDHFYAAITALAAEMWTLRRRLNTFESLSEKHGAVTVEMTEKYVPTAEETAKWNAQRDQFIKLVFDPFLRKADIPYGSSLHRDGKPKKT